uniref:ATP-binding cassette sub-family A member 6 n=1 Tax=Jaculus jaculus TaxID=51337 RepID=UPI001E1B46EC|nr:ATP-binding cassette sub-family A member 6 [Jaculus jaculus]
MFSDFPDSEMSMKEISLYQQTKALLHKNFLQKWRMKRESLLEWSLPILIGLYMGLISDISENIRLPELPPQDLGRVDKFNSSSAMIVYTPISNTTQQIMNKTVFASFMQDATIIGAPNKTHMDKLLLENFPHAMGVIFQDTFSYKLKLILGYGIPLFKEESLPAHCWNLYSGFSCPLSTYWTRGFVALQSVLNAAIVEITTNHSVMEELTSVTAINMKTLPFISKDLLQNEIFILLCLLYFSPVIYFVSLNVTKERKQRKDLMTMMGLQNSAFWLSWGLLYAGVIFITSIVITIVITSSQIIVLTGFMVIFTLFFLYGLSLIALTFLMSVLLQKAALTNLIMLLLSLLWGCVGLTVLYRQLPSSLQWILSIFSPFAFSAGMAQIIHLDYNLNGVVFPDPSGDSYVMIATYSILAFDGLIYLILALYFDKILPHGDEHRSSPLFFLNSPSCFQHGKTNNRATEKDIDLELPTDDFEPIASEFQGKEAIRIRNVKKEYKGKSGKVEALKGLFFDIYESQITAILGHSGAGKSSLLNILNGLSVPTEGSVTIYNKNLSEMQDLKEIRKITGVCPQHNVQFDALTVKENLHLFATVKGIHPGEVAREVQKILLEMDMQPIQDNLAESLSEGQKRKLTFGIAMLGEPRILLLDEPTVGLDPFSRQRVWSFLNERRANRVILLSTQFVDEADILADRKMIMSSGSLKYAGSSVFLKRKWGLGYHLSLYRNEACDPEQITSSITHHIPDAKLKIKNKEKLVYTLPLERTNKFPDLFSDLEKYTGKDMMGYDVSMSTLNEVFMNLEGESTTKPVYVHVGFKCTEMVRDSESLSEVESTYSSLPDVHKALSSMCLWRMQVCAMARLRLLKLKRGRKSLLTLLLIFGIGLFPLIMEKQAHSMVDEGADWEFKTELYFLSPGQLPQDLRTSLLIINNTESNIEDFIQSLKHQNILLEVDDFENRNGTEGLSYNGAIIVSGKQKDYRFSVVCNTKRVHCFPVLMNVISNGLLRMFNQTQRIRIERSSFSFKHKIWVGLPDGSIFLLFVVCSISPYIAMSSASDYKRKADSQLWVSGLYPSAYWCGQAIVDISLFNLIFSLMYLIFYITKIIEMSTVPQIILPMAIFSFGYAASLIFLAYLISFIFCKRRKNNGLWSLCYYIVLTFMFDIVQLNFFSLATISSMTLIPLISLGAYLVFFAVKAHENYQEFQDPNYDISGVDYLMCLIPYFHTLLCIFALRCMELKYGKKVMRKDPVFRISPRSPDVQPSPEYPTDEDEDVQAERARASAALSTSSSDEKPGIIASCLYKEYTGHWKSCFSKRKKTVATRNISFCVKKGEVLGLLGPNGAGKSSCIKMIAGITKPTSGEVELSAGSPAGARQRDALRCGYCPQQNALWPSLTPKEHLQVYAAVKGLRKEDAAAVIHRLVGGFKLQEQLDVPVRNLAAGATRKLGFALGVLGNAPVLLLDEPSTGADPAGRRRMWQVIQAAVKNTERSVLLITNDLAEAEAVCDRVAVMVSGRLRCIGSIQHLKKKFGKDYILELKVKEPSSEPLVHTEVLKLFPQAARQERCFASLTYKLPIADVYPLSEAFHKLEAVKHNFNLEEYSLSQCTLEKVILELSKEQELGNDDEDIDTTMRWRLLPHSDEP